MSSETQIVCLMKDRGISFAFDNGMWLLHQEQHDGRVRYASDENLRDAYYALLMQEQ